MGNNFFVVSISGKQSKHHEHERRRFADADIVATPGADVRLQPGTIEPQQDLEGHERGRSAGTSYFI